MIRDDAPFDAGGVELSLFEVCVAMKNTLHEDNPTLFWSR
jgi:hypothetical protein